jgi:DNA-binding MarR family transcriptional regulator
MTEEQLGDQLRQADPQPITAALAQLQRRSLVQEADGGAIALTTSGRADYERLVEARCAGLRELLSGWDPDSHAQLQELVDKLARDLVSEIPRPGAVPTTANP